MVCERDFYARHKPRGRQGKSKWQKKRGKTLGGKWAVTTGKPDLEAGSPKGFRTHVSAVRGRRILLVYQRLVPNPQRFQAG